MMQIMNRLASFTNSQGGQGMVEYAFILSLIVVILIVVVAIVGNQTVNMWSDIQGTMKNATR
jgi:Flp pilus assembly pilin Flp